MNGESIPSPLKYVGGKSKSAERIIALFPPISLYTTYVEPCFGAGWVLFAKPKGKHTEIANDRDNNLIAFWRAVQTQREALVEMLQLPYSRALYYEYYPSLFDDTDMTQLERAARFFYCLRGTGTGWLRESPPGWEGDDKNRTAFQNILKGEFKAIQQRIAKVVIDNRDVLDTIERYDLPKPKREKEKTLFYIDPPYYGKEWYYKASEDGFPHKEMAALLREVKGYVAVSYYPHPDIDELYPPDSWYRTTWEVRKHSQIGGGTEHPEIATEMLLTNYPTTGNTLWSEDI